MALPPSPSPPPAPEPAGDADRQWLERLQGKPVAATDAEALWEADALRLALDAERQAEEADADLEDDTSDEALQHDWERLQFRWKREGLLVPRPKPWWQRMPAAAGLAAAVALAAVLLPLQQGDGDGDDRYDPPPVMRGEHQLHWRTVDAPRMAAEAFAEKLREAGLRPGIYRSGKTYTVDVDIKAAELAAAAPAFASAALPPPAAGFTRIEFAPR